MSQHGLSIANQPFPSFRTDLNGALAALKSMNSGDSAPENPVAGMLWYDTVASLVKVYNGAQWQQIPAPETVQFDALHADVFATQLEAEDGTETDKLMTPERVKQAIVAQGASGLKYCHVGRSGSQTLLNGAHTKIEFNLNTGDFSDPFGWFDTTTNYRFQPDEAGVFLIEMSWCLNAFSGTKYSSASLYKNGSMATPSFWSNHGMHANIQQNFRASYMLPLNGTTDYLEGRVSHNYGSTITLYNQVGLNTFTAIKISG